MKVTLYQTHIIWEEKETNYLHLETKLKEMQGKTDLMLLPEMSFTGFSMKTDVTKESHFETVNRMVDFAKKYQQAIGFGWVKDCGEKSENHYTIVDKNGEIITDYAKIHPFSFSGEDEKFRGGNKINVFGLNGIRCSVFICYDLRFPQIFQIASRQAHVIIIPANWPAARSEHWKCLLRARAIENQAYILAVNCVGEMNGLRYMGDSCIIDPIGRVLMELSGREGVIDYIIEDDVESYRAAFPIEKDRREDLYIKYESALFK